jgi:hypothetical protein
MIFNNRLTGFLLIAAMVLLEGCVAVQSFPTVARSGDTVTLAVGSVDGMNKSNTTATFVSDVDASSASLTIRAIIRLRPDQTSNTALFDSFVNAEDSYTGHSQWITVMVIDLPPGLTVGAGHIDVQTTAYTGTFTYNINDIPIALEIIDGTGVPNQFTYNTGFDLNGTATGNLSSLEALPQVVFKPLTATSGTYFAAAEIKVTIPTQNVAPPGFRVVADDFYTKNPQDQLQMNWTKNGDDFTVNFIGPKGGVELKQLRFSVVTAADNFLTNPGPVITSVKLYDINGEPVTITSGVPNANSFVLEKQ